MTAGLPMHMSACLLVTGQLQQGKTAGQKKARKGSALKLPPKGGWRKYEKTFKCIKCISIF
jgi:hypothetical protein